MTHIGLLSDTHGYLDGAIFDHFKKCNEIWHAGDFGNIGIANELMEKSGVPVRGVFGNIDGNDVRARFPEILRFNCEEVKVMIKHIGGSPPRYNPQTKRELLAEKPGLFISGHSHILKVMYDQSLGCLHMNPGAAGKHGWHKMRTAIRFVIDGTQMKDCEVIELGKR
jgi:putative phosphoesterase